MLLASLCRSLVERCHNTVVVRCRSHKIVVGALRMWWSMPASGRTFESQRWARVESVQAATCVADSLTYSETKVSMLASETSAPGVDTVSCSGSCRVHTHSMLALARRENHCYC